MNNHPIWQLLLGHGEALKDDHGLQFLATSGACEDHGEVRLFMAGGCYMYSAASRSTHSPCYRSVESRGHLIHIDHFVGMKVKSGDVPVVK